MADPGERGPEAGEERVVGLEGELGLMDALLKHRSDVSADGDSDGKLVAHMKMLRSARNLREEVVKWVDAAMTRLAANDNAIHIAALKKSGFSITCDERHNGSHFKFAEEASAGNWPRRSRSRNDVVAKEGQAGSASGKTAKGKAKKGAKPDRKPQRCKLCGESGHNAATCKNSKSRQRLLAAREALYYPLTLSDSVSKDETSAGAGLHQTSVQRRRIGVHIPPSDVPKYCSSNAVCTTYEIPNLRTTIDAAVLANSHPYTDQSPYLRTLAREYKNTAFAGMVNPNLTTVIAPRKGFGCGRST